jgi:hypothetical protein
LFRASENADYIIGRYGIPLTERERQRLLIFRGACYLMLLAYMAILLVNAVAIVACFLGVAFGWLTLDWKYLASWAGGTTGLGAGSLLFKSVLDYLFGIGGGRPRVAANVASRDRVRLLKSFEFRNVRRVSFGESGPTPPGCPWMAIELCQAR